MRRISEMNTADRGMARTRIFFMAGTILLVALWAAVIGSKVGFGVIKGRTNPQQSGTKRVLDWADMLTDEQEEALEKKIASAEKAISADIVILIMNESIEEKYPDLIYMRSDETDAYKGIRRYAEEFWVDQGYGWNEPGDTGNGIIMVDNIYRESNGWVYNWVAGAGDLRFSVGNDNCQELSQSFTDRLPYGDMPRYSQTYADALMSFVDDCSTFGLKLRGMLGWRLYTPASIFATITSSIAATIAVFIILCILFGRMIWHLHYNGRQKKDKSAKKKSGSFLAGLGGTVVMMGFFILASYNTFTAVAAVFAAVIIYLVVAALKGKQESDDSDKKKGKKGEKAGAPFARKIMLAPDAYDIVRKDNRLVRRYTTSYTESDSSSSGGGFSGGGGGGGFSGGGGGGGFSGGGSHR